MEKLLRANFTRMLKSYTFWICAAAAFLIGLCASIVTAASGSLWHVKWEPHILGRFKEAPFFAAVFSSLFLGTEYSNGTLRNKLMIGSDRTSIYLSNLICTVSGGLLITAAELLVPMGYGIILFTTYKAPEPKFWSNIGICAGTIAAFCSLLTLFGMICSKKAVTVMTAICVTIICYLTSGTVTERLNDNSGYYDGIYVHTALSVVDRVLPFGTIERVSDGYREVQSSVPLFSLGTVAVSTAVGIAIFRKKDIK